MWITLSCDYSVFLCLHIFIFLLSKWQKKMLGPSLYKNTAAVQHDCSLYRHTQARFSQAMRSEVMAQICCPASHMLIYLKYFHGCCSNTPQGSADIQTNSTCEKRNPNDFSQIRDNRRLFRMPKYRIQWLWQNEQLEVSDNSNLQMQTF